MTRRPQRPAGLDREATWRWHLEHTIVPYGSCWLWTGRVNSSGYPVVWVDGRHEYAHRLAWSVVRGAIPEGQTVHHVCGGLAGLGKMCVRPGHLQLATHVEQAAEMHARRAYEAALTGHYDRLTDLRGRIAALEEALRGADPDHPLLTHD